MTWDINLLDVSLRVIIIIRSIRCGQAAETCATITFALAFRGSRQRCRLLTLIRLVWNCERSSLIKIGRRTKLALIIRRPFNHSKTGAVRRSTRVPCTSIYCIKLYLNNTKFIHPCYGMYIARSTGQILVSK